MLQTVLGIAAMILIQLGGVKLFGKLGILDKPGPDVPKRDRVPTIQGVVGIIAVLAGIVVSGNMYVLVHDSFLGMRVGGALIFLITLSDELGRIIDKRLRVGAFRRLIVQLGASLIAGWISYESLFPIGIFGYEITGVLGFLVLVAWFLLFINAINRFDGVYGLSTGVASVGFGTIAALLPLVVIPAFPDITPERLQLLDTTTLIALFFFVMTAVGAWIEFKPTGLMRDVGTMTIGFALAYLALVGGAKIGTLIVVLAFPLMDAAWVILDRVIRRKINPMKGDFTHLHYRLMVLGWTRTEVRLTVWISSVCFAVLMLLQGTNSVNKIIIFLMAAILFFGINIYLFWHKGLRSEYDWREGSEKERELVKEI